MREEGARFALGTQHPFRSLERFLAAACNVFRTDAAMLGLIDNDIVRVIATWGIPNEFITHPQPFSEVPYTRYETVLVRDATSRNDLHEFLRPLELERTGFFFRTPLLIEGVQTAGLIVYGRDPRPQVSQADVKFVQDIARSLSYSVDLMRGTETTANFLETVGLTYETIRDWVTGNRDGAVLLTSDLVAIAASESTLRLLPFHIPGQEPINIRLLDEAVVQNFVFYLRQVLKSGFSLPAIEVSTEPLAPDWPFKQHLMITASPIRPIDRQETYLVLTIRDISVRTAFQEHVEASLPVSPVNTDMTTIEFLVETLIARRRVHSRRDTSFITMRCWRRSIRAHQITALKAIKRNNPRPLAMIAAEEIALDIKTLIGAQAFHAIVPMPCGHSTPGSCLSHAIAVELGLRLGLPVIPALHLPRTVGSSHPKNNVRRPRMRLSSPIEGPVILVDDVATSGEHMREARELLVRSCGSVFAIAWIGGDASDEGG